MSHLDHGKGGLPQPVRFLGQQGIQPLDPGSCRVVDVDQGDGLVGLLDLVLAQILVPPAPRSQS